MKTYTWELKSHDQLKRILELSLKLNGFHVEFNPSNGHKLQKGQDRFEPPIKTVVMQTESFWCKFLYDTRDGGGKINIPDALVDRLIWELELKLLAKEVEIAKTIESKEAVK